MYETILSPVCVGGLTLKNRIIFAPTTMGLFAAEYENKIRALAAGGCGMIIIGDVPVAQRGMFSLNSKKTFAHYRKLCEIVHSEGGKICAQLHQSDSNMMGMLQYLPAVLTKRITMEQLRPLLNEQVGTYITGMPAEKVANITASFGTAAAQAVRAGFDMVQVHGDRMCGSFSSALFNRRTDCYGGSATNRARFAVEAVTAVHKAMPKLPIDYKLAVRQENPHYGNAGVLLDELPAFVPLLEQAGVTSFHVALANHAKLSDAIPPKTHAYYAHEGCFLQYCDAVRKLTALPICGVGGLTSPDFVEEQLKSGRIQCAAMSRQLIADSAWPSKLQQGKAGKILPCIRCNKECLGGMQAHKGVHCIYEKKEQKA